ncbi:MAG: 3-phosphoshikimate 1-carboxyvinyltransferase [Desulfatiglandales bacterium]|jgi:3-phosphoshikimate 1-carboxyvinyltransferase|nr:3-phosphoshikimate 1-carboxyvinyltransferase [Desulfatiglandales bacterium]
MKEIHPRPSIDASVRIPGSKSVTHRALITAGLADGESLLKEFLPCEDTLFTLSALRGLGVQISIEGANTIVSGTGGKFPVAQGRKEIFLGDSGTSYRLLLSTVALARGDYVLTGTPRMQERPVGDLVRALHNLGVEASCMEQDNFPPVLIRAKGIHGGRVEIPGELSSQYVSSILLSGPYAEKEVEIEIRGRLVSRPYVDITLDVMKMFGVEVNRDGYRCFRISSGLRYQPSQFIIEGDMSSASYFWGAAAVTGGTLTTENIHPHTTRQGDVVLLDILEEMGCRVERETERVVVQGGELSGIEVDMGAMPDMVPTLAAIALFARGKTAIRNVSHLRLKESDRLGAVAFEWRRLGGRVEELEDGIIIHGGERLSGGVMDPHNDHRLAMSLAIAGLRVPGIKIKNEHCVNKSFPRFWELWDGL